MRWVLLLVVISGCAVMGPSAAQRAAIAENEMRRAEEDARAEAGARARVAEQQRQRAAIDAACQKALTDPAGEATRAACIQFYASEREAWAAEQVRRESDERTWDQERERFEAAQEEKRRARAAAWQAAFPRRHTVKCRNDGGGDVTCTEY